MLKLYHYPFDPLCRYARLLLAEYAIDVELVEEAPWQRRHEFLLLNPAATIPVFTELHRKPVVGVWALSEYLEETRGERYSRRHLMPDHASERAEVRRLCDWFHNKFYQEVSSLIVEEKIFKRMRMKEGRREDITVEALHVARKNIRGHLSYLDYLLDSKPWLVGEQMTLADLAAAAHLSSLDYFADIPWEEVPAARDWYAKIKSRPTFRPFLAERIEGCPPTAHYTNLDF